MLENLPDSPGQSVSGWLLDLDLEGYEAVCRFEPRHLYRWTEALAIPTGARDNDPVNTNVLIGRSPAKGGPEGSSPVWRSADDPVLVFGPAVAFGIF